MRPSSPRDNRLSLCKQTKNPGILVVPGFSCLEGGGTVAWRRRISDGSNGVEPEQGKRWYWGMKKRSKKTCSESVVIQRRFEEIRTPDTLLKRQVLCRLSYWIKCINRPKSVYRTAVQRMEVPSTNMKKMIARTFVIFASFASLVRPLFFP